MALSQDIIDVVANVNLKYQGEYGTLQMAQSHENTITHLSRLDRLSEGFVGRMLLDYAQPDVGEAIADKARLTGDAVAEKALNVIASLAGGQILGKQGNNSPPPTP